MASSASQEVVLLSRLQVGEVFADRDALKDVLLKYRLLRGREHHTVRSCQTRIEYKCTDAFCSFTFKARMQQTGLFKVRARGEERGGR